MSAKFVRVPDTSGKGSYDKNGRYHLNLHIAPDPVHIGPFGHRDLNHDRATAFYELVLDLNTWHEDGVTGLTREVLEEAQRVLTKPNLPVSVHLPSGKTETFGLERRGTLTTEDGRRRQARPMRSLVGEW